MRKAIVVIALTLCCAASAMSGWAENSIDVSALRALPVQYKGRIQPLESLAIESAQLIYGRSRVRGLRPTVFFMEVLSRPGHWRNEPIIRIDFEPLKEALGFEQERKYFSFNELASSETFGRMVAESEAKAERDEALTPLDRKVEAAALGMRIFDALVNGELLKIIPPRRDDPQAWIPVAHFGFPHASGQGGIMPAFQAVVDAYGLQSEPDFSRALDRLSETLRATDASELPNKGKLRMELSYYDIKPFRMAWIIYLLGGLLLVLGSYFRKRALTFLGGSGFIAAFIFHTLGLVMRTLILSRPPVSNMFESVAFMAWSVSVFALIFAAVHRQSMYLRAASFVGAAILVWGSLMPFNQSLDVLTPVLRSNYWLIIHVLTIVSSYGAFALAAGLSHVVLGYYAWAPGKTDHIGELTFLSYRVIQIGVILLAAGTILGGVWANESWGRFWGWDPKETWALISLLGYLGLMHARYVGWVRDFGLAVGSLACFLLVLMTWYGVNFVLGKGLHSYGFGAGGGHWVTGFVLFELAFLGWTCFERYGKKKVRAH